MAISTGFQIGPPGGDADHSGPEMGTGVLFDSSVPGQAPVSPKFLVKPGESALLRAWNYPDGGEPIRVVMVLVGSWKADPGGGKPPADVTWTDPPLGSEGAWALTEERPMALLSLPGTYRLMLPDDFNLEEAGFLVTLDRMPTPPWARGPVMT